jgi:hypothetical protein
LDERKKHMVENLFVVALCAVVLGAAVWGWWLENGHSIGKKEKDNVPDTGEDA